MMLFTLYSTQRVAATAFLGSTAKVNLIKQSYGAILKI